MSARLVLFLSLIGLTALVLLSGCGGTKPPAYKSTESDKTADQNPWARIAAPLRKDSDVPSCRQVLSQLNNDLVGVATPGIHPESLSPEDEKKLRDWLALSESELKEIRSPSFGGLDPHYLAECLYLADAARSLDVATLPPERQALAAFQWVCRQVVLSPWTLQMPDGTRGISATIPSGAVLRRGSGSGLERAFVFVSVVRQLGLDAGLVGGPGAEKQEGTIPHPLTDRAPPRGPFWAVGVRVGPDVYLFDPWRGEPVPGPEGRPATLAQVRAKPEFLKPWRENPAQPWTVPVEAVQGATLYLTMPLSGLAPRFKRLESELKADQATRLFVDAAALLARFQTEAKLPETKFWTPPVADLSTDLSPSMTRVLGAYFPPEDGGFSRLELSQRYILTLVPRTIFTVPVELEEKGELDPGVPEARDRLRMISGNMFVASFVVPPIPREQIHRGNFADVTSTLVQKRKAYAAAQQRVLTDRNRSNETSEWCAKVRGVYERLSKAKRSTNPGDQAEAQLAVDLFWKNESRVAQALVDFAVADAGQAEATFLLALCMHEQAERAHQKYDRLRANPREKTAADKARQDAIIAWGEALGWWKLYDQGPGEVQSRTYPARQDHAVRTAAQAAARLAELGSR